MIIISFREQDVNDNLKTSLLNSATYFNCVNFTPHFRIGNQLEDSILSIKYRQFV